MALEDRFDIEAPVHVGQIATSYPAFFKDTSEKVLLKILHPQWLKDPEIKERFEREGEAVSRINHPHVIKIREIGYYEDTPYIAIDWVEGETLKQKISAGPIKQTTILKHARELLSGLGSIHKNELVHRDLKPDNILIGEDNQVRITDFSLAGLKSGSAITEHGAIVGSPAYMAPELISGHASTISSDLYSIGIILLEMLTGSNPFQSSDPMLSLDKIRNYSPPKFANRDSVIPALGELIDSLLAKNPPERPENADAALSILNGVSDSSQGKTTSYSTESNRTGFRKNIVVVVIVMLIISLTTFVIKSIQKNNPQSIELSSNSILDFSSTPDESENLDIIQTFADTGLGITQDLDSFPTETSSTNRKSIQIHDTPAILNPKATSMENVTIIARPWAQIQIDGKDYGISPIGTIDLAAGSHEIVLTNRRYPDFNDTFTVYSGRSDTLEFDLHNTISQVDFSVAPWGYLWIGEDSIGLLPRSEPVILAPGEYYLSIKHPKYNTLKDTLVAKSGKDFRYSINFNDGTIIAD